MSSKRRPTPGPTRVVVYNTSPSPVMVATSGAMCPGSSTTTVNPEDPRTAWLIAAGELVVKENA
ncbi:hypothetical protein [Kocuria rhizophila]|uniref:hypothetical protein n=1 Tax=Kocuria rhizophila TaxID=72000 RepID=UPI001EF63F46|nr:hypothetical protein [Kocuria rhizophila]MCG7424609.1 hypothetical protein [Kocuria rhizophila]MCT1879865.1 hypothetical protein [Kocuria rhizophila]WSY88690.1 hypothetical protein OH783_01530 [Kocuria rhizophila]WSZ54118.1 hypothetical protein OG926_01535 [Kocuria rhizophila]